MKATHKLVHKHGGGEWLLSVDVVGKVHYMMIKGGPMINGEWWASRKPLADYQSDNSFSLTRLNTFKGNK